MNLATYISLCFLVQCNNTIFVVLGLTLPFSPLPPLSPLPFSPPPLLSPLCPPSPDYQLGWLVKLHIAQPVSESTRLSLICSQGMCIIQRDWSLCVCGGGGRGTGHCVCVCEHCVCMHVYMYVHACLLPYITVV